MKDENVTKITETYCIPLRSGIFAYWKLLSGCDAGNYVTKAFGDDVEELLCSVQ